MNPSNQPTRDPSTTPSMSPSVSPTGQPTGQLSTIASSSNAINDINEPSSSSQPTAHYSMMYATQSTQASTEYEKTAFAINRNILFSIIITIGILLLICMFSLLYYCDKKVLKSQRKKTRRKIANENKIAKIIGCIILEK